MINKIGLPRSGSPISKSRVWLQTELDDTAINHKYFTGEFESCFNLRFCSNFRLLRLNRANGETYRGNNQKINSAHILRLSRPWCETNHDKLVWLNIDLFTRNSIITEFRLNATFGAQNLRRISRPYVTK